jgi:GNAT superfamily N-acetyltransferase
MPTLPVRIDSPGVLSVRQAGPADLDAVTAILADATRWLHASGIDQWPPGLPSHSPAALSAQIDRGETYLVTGQDQVPAATIALSAHGDPDYWTAAELADSTAVYVQKAAVIRSRAGEGIGALLLRWIVDRAALNGAKWARLDTSKTNPAIGNYYRAQGWTYLRTADAPHRRGGILFQRAAVPELAARVALPAR